MTPPTEWRACLARCREWIADETADHSLNCSCEQCDWLTHVSGLLATPAPQEPTDCPNDTPLGRVRLALHAKASEAFNAALDAQRRGDGRRWTEEMQRSSDFLWACSLCVQEEGKGVGDD